MTAAKVIALKNSPFIYSLLAGAEVRLSNQVPIAAVSRRGVLIINPMGMQEAAVTPEQAVSLLLHESLHLGLGHFKRVGNRHKMTYNIAADALINDMLIGAGYIIDLPVYKKGELVTPGTLSRKIQIPGKSSYEIADMVKGMDAEQVYDLIIKQVYKGKPPPEIGQPKPSKGGKQAGKPSGACPVCGGRPLVPGGEGPEGVKGLPSVPGRPVPGSHQPSKELSEDVGWTSKSDDIIDKDLEGEIIQKGNEDLYNEDPITGEIEYDPKAGLNKATTDAELMGRGIGTLPANLRRIIEKMTKPKVDWRSKLRTSLNRGFGSIIITTYRRPSRIMKGLPSYKRLGKPTVHALIDTSGSIGSDELEQFMSEIYSIAQNKYGVRVTPWDAEAYSTIDAHTPSDVVSKVVPKIKGGDGTDIGPVAKHLLKDPRFKNKDAVVIMTDGDIFDLGRPEVQHDLNSIASRTSSFIVVSVRKSKEEFAKELPKSAVICEVRS